MTKLESLIETLVKFKDFGCSLSPYEEDETCKISQDTFETAVGILELFDEGTLHRVKIIPDENNSLLVRLPNNKLLSIENCEIVYLNTKKYD